MPIALLAMSGCSFWCPLARCETSVTGGALPPAGDPRTGRGGGLAVVARRVDRPDDQRVHRRWSAGEPRSRDGALDDQDGLTDAAPEDVEGHQPRAGPRDLDLEERPAGQPVDAPGGPHVPGDDRSQHYRSISTWTPSLRALSRASGVSTARRPRTRRSPAAAAAATVFSVTAPCSTRRAGPGPAGDDRGSGR